MNKYRAHLSIFSMENSNPTTPPPQKRGKSGLITQIHQLCFHQIDSVEVPYIECSSLSFFRFCHTYFHMIQYAILQNKTQTQQNEIKT